MIIAAALNNFRAYYQALGPDAMFSAIEDMAEIERQCKTLGRAVSPEFVRKWVEEKYGETAIMEVQDDATPGKNLPTTPGHYWTRLVGSDDCYVGFVDERMDSVMIGDEFFPFRLVEFGPRVEPPEGWQ